MIGNRIKWYRTKSGLTQEALAGKIGKQQSVMAKYEQDQVDIPTSVLEQIAEALDISPCTLLKKRKNI